MRLQEKKGERSPFLSPKNRLNRLLSFLFLSFPPAGREGGEKKGGGGLGITMEKRGEGL